VNATKKTNTGLAPVLCFSSEHKIAKRHRSPVGARLAGEGVITAAARLKAAFCFCSTTTTEIRADKTE
jgi:hypothetical protein